ncbi:alpha/beta hydrolase [Maricaulaceae bacterium NA33B04]|nr:alpha/beta hydrolase [Maricaulaceae bacterium NA33B04]
MRLLALTAALALAACSAEDSAPTRPDIPMPTDATDPYADDRPIGWQPLLERERELADHRIEYGDGEEQYGELWLPDASVYGDGPHPTVIMIHGGCWQAAIPGTILQDQLNADLRRRGYAVWNITYPRLGHETGGYPGTFISTAMAVDHVGVLAEDYPLDLNRAVIMGHSAGGHLAAWAAARSNLPDGPLSALRDGAFMPNGLITLAGINDLLMFRDAGLGRCGEPDTVDQLVGAEARTGADIFADTSPSNMLPLGIEQVVISGELDPIVPAQYGRAYAAYADQEGDTVTEISIDEAGHFELIDPTAPAWAVILQQIERLTAE